MATAGPGRLIAAFLVLACWPMAGAAQEPLWKSHMAAGQSAFEQNDLNAAGEQFEAALVAAEDFPATDPRIGLTLNNLATVYNFRGEFAKAEPLLLRARQIWEQAPPPGELHLAATLHNLAGLYFSQGRYDEVEPLLRRALEIRERALPPDHPALEKTRKSMATLKQSLERIAAATPEPSPSTAASEPDSQAAATPEPQAQSPSQAAPTATIPRAGGIVIHLASLRTVQGANREWDTIKQAHPDLVQGLEPDVVEVDLGERGIFQRLFAGRFPDRASAIALCRKFKAKEQYCAVVER